MKGNACVWFLHSFPHPNLGTRLSANACKASGLWREQDCKHFPEPGVFAQIRAPMNLCGCRYACSLLHICRFVLPAKINACTDVCLSKRARRSARRCM